MHHEIRVDRLEHQALRGGDLAQTGEVLAPERPQVRVRQHPALESALARPGHVAGEVGVAVVSEACGHLGVHLRTLAGEHEQLLGAAAGRAVEDALDLVRRVQMRRWVANAQYLQ